MKLHLEIQPRIPRFVLERNRRLFDPCSAIANRATIKRTETGGNCLLEKTLFQCLVSIEF